MTVLTKEQIKKMNIISNVLDIQYQPHGVDLSIDKIYEFKSKGTIDFFNDKRELSDKNEIEFNDSDDYSYLYQNTCLNLKSGKYLVEFNELVQIPKGIMALSYSRSSLLRCGASIESAIWDSGFKGKGITLLSVDNKYGIKLYKNSRIAQMIFIKLNKKNDELYNGIYNRK